MMIQPFLLSTYLIHSSPSLTAGSPWVSLLTLVSTQASSPIRVTVDVFDVSAGSVIATETKECWPRTTTQFKVEVSQRYNDKNKNTEIEIFFIRN